MTNTGKILGESIRISDINIRDMFYYDNCVFVIDANQPDETSITVFNITMSRGRTLNKDTFVIPLGSHKEFDLVRKEV